jgi:hypothetical protein
MSSLPPRQTIKDLGLEESQEVSLYLELIRIIERDIDEIKAGNTRNGWTSWAIVGGIAAALSILFGETRKLTSFPTGDIKEITLSGILLYNFVSLFMRSLYFNEETTIRPGRLRWSKDAYFSFVPSAIFSVIILLTSIIFAVGLEVPVWIKLLTIVAFALWTIWTVLLLVLSRIQFPLGNNKSTRKSGRIISLITMVLSFAAAGSLGTQLSFPIGEVATLPYIISGLILVVLFLIGHLISTLAPSRLLSNLKDLRNEIIFLRIEIDEALKRYEVISEGETFPDAIQKELSTLLTDLNIIEYAHSNMDRLIKQMSAGLPRKTDSAETRKQKATQVGLDKDSYFLHQARCEKILRSLGTKLKDLSKKQSRVGGVTEDWASENIIRSALIQRLEAMDRVEQKLKQDVQLIEYYLNNPEKIPDEPEPSAEKPDVPSQTAQ